MSIILCFKLYYSEHHLGTLIVKCVECGKSLLNKIKLNERGNLDHFDWNFHQFPLFHIIFIFYFAGSNCGLQSFVVITIGDFLAKGFAT